MRLKFYLVILLLKPTHPLMAGTLFIPPLKTYSYCEHRLKNRLENGIENRHFSNQIKVSSFNIKSGNYLYSKKNNSQEKLVESISKLDFDVLALQEVEWSLFPKPFGTARVDIVDRIAKKYKLCGVFIDSLSINFKTYGFLNAYHFGNALLSRYPITDIRAVLLPRATHPPTMKFGIVDLQKTEPRSFVVANINISKNDTITVATTHLSLSPFDQVPQMSAISSYLKPLGDLILLGDFNAIRESVAFDAFLKLNPEYRFAAQENLWKKELKKGNAESEAIDHILLKGNRFKTTSFSIRSDIVTSDHFPIEGKFSF